MYARVSRIKGTPEKMDALIRQYREEVVPAVERLRGKGAYLYVDRKTGLGMSITLWETESDMQASEKEADRLRASATQTASARQPAEVERYEVAVQPARIPV